jgi:hypothetical protein
LIWKHRMQESYFCIKYVFKPGQGGGLQWFDVPKRDPDDNVMTDGDGNVIGEVLLDAEDIHKALLERNKWHFHQAHDMTFGGSKEDTTLFDLVGYSGLSEAAKLIVEGNFMEKYGGDIDIIPKMEQLIKELAMPAVIQELSKKIEYLVDDADFITGFKVWNECMSTSLQGNDQWSRSKEETRWKEMGDWLYSAHGGHDKYSTQVWIHPTTMV